MQLKVYRKDNRKKDERRRRRQFFRIGAALGVIVLALTLYRLSEPLRLAVDSLRAFVTDSEYFSVREIQVRGGDKVSGSEIVGITGLQQGMSIWKVDLAAIEKKVAQHPWVRRVLVRREFPGRIIIEVEERVPRAIVALRRLYYVDSDGVLFKEVGPGENVKYPLLTGLRAEELTTANPGIRRRIQDAIRLGELMARRSHSLSEIHFDAPDRLVVYTTDFPIALRMGWGDWEEKMMRMERLMSLWKGNEARLGSLDMSYRDQVVARLRQVEQ
jgi:cell division protein FtsQ